MIYLFLEKPESNISRVSHRVLNGGHHVPKDDIIRRFYRSKEMFMYVYKDLVDKWIMYYNSDEITKNSVLYFQLPDGTITMENPFETGELKERLDTLISKS